MSPRHTAPPNRFRQIIGVGSLSLSHPLSSLIFCLLLPFISPLALIFSHSNSISLSIAVPIVFANRFPFLPFSLSSSLLLLSPPSLLPLPPPLSLAVMPTSSSLLHYWHLHWWVAFDIIPVRNCTTSRLHNRLLLSRNGVLLSPALPKEIESPNIRSDCFSHSHGDGCHGCHIFYIVLSSTHFWFLFFPTVWLDRGSCHGHKNRDFGHPKWSVANRHLHVSFHFIYRHTCVDRSTRVSFRY